MNIFVIAGPSGVGKSHLINELAKKGIHPLEVYTDRERRPSETDVTDRVYLSCNEFTKSLSEFLYWFNFQGSRYGYKKEDIEKNKRLKRSVVFNIPPTFLPNLLDKLPETISIYLNIDVSNTGLLYDRMLTRDISDNDTKEMQTKKIKAINKRLAYAKKELKNIPLIQDAMSRNPLSKTFYILDDSTLYSEVIPYILKIDKKTL